MNEEQLNAIAIDLDECPDPETLDALRQCWNPAAMNAACKRLSPERHAQIKAWVLALNAATADDAATVATGANAAEDEELVQSELFPELGQQPRHLSPGDWQWEV
jgi:DNA-binding FadR family transcriptional regulator